MTTSTDTDPALEAVRGAIRKAADAATATAAGYVSELNAPLLVTVRSGALDAALKAEVERGVWEHVAVEAEVVRSLEELREHVDTASREVAEKAAEKPALPPVRLASLDLRLAALRDVTALLMTFRPQPRAANHHQRTRPGAVA